MVLGVFVIGALLAAPTVLLGYIASAFVASSWFMPIVVTTTAVVLGQLDPREIRMPMPIQLTQPWADFFREVEEMVVALVRPREQGQEWELVGEE